MNLLPTDDKIFKLNHSDEFITESEFIDMLRHNNLLDDNKKTYCANHFEKLSFKGRLDILSWRYDKRSLGSMHAPASFGLQRITQCPNNPSSYIKMLDFENICNLWQWNHLLPLIEYYRDNIFGIEAPLQIYTFNSNITLFLMQLPKEYIKDALMILIGSENPIVVNSSLRLLTNHSNFCIENDFSLTIDEYEKIKNALIHTMEKTEFDDITYHHINHTFGYLVYFYHLSSYCSLMNALIESLVCNNRHKIYSSIISYNLSEPDAYLSNRDSRKEIHQAISNEHKNFIKQPEIVKLINKNKLLYGI